jgi:hypothetical protein
MVNEWLKCGGSLRLVRTASLGDSKQTPTTFVTTQQLLEINVKR